jgi:hypothetical protein
VLITLYSVDFSWIALMQWFLLFQSIYVPLTFDGRRTGRIRNCAQSHRLRKEECKLWSSSLYKFVQPPFTWSIIVITSKYPKGNLRSCYSKRSNLIQTKAFLEDKDLDKSLTSVVWNDALLWEYVTGSKYLQVFLCYIERCEICVVTGAYGRVQCAENIQNIHLYLLWYKTEN